MVKMNCGAMPATLPAAVRSAIVADMPSVLLETTLTAVTVYPDTARVTRRGTATVPAGEGTIVIGGLPQSLIPDTARVSVFAAGVRVGGVDVAATFEPAAVPANLDQRLV